MGQTPTPPSAKGASSPDPSNPQQKPRLRDRYFAGWVVASAIVPIPILASLITLLIYASLHPVIALPAHPELEWLGVGWVVILFGMLITVIIWALLAFPCGYFATPDGGNSRSSSKLRNQYDVLKTRFDRIKNTIPRTSTTIPAPGSTPPTDDDFMKQTALDEIERAFKYIDDKWTRNGMTWVVSRGYIDLWRRIHTIEESLIEVLPPGTIIKDASHDLQRLKGSKIPGSEALTTMLNEAIGTLNPSASPAPATPASALASPPLSQVPTLQQKAKLDEQMAKSNIRSVRSTINKYLRERWESLIRTRNILMGVAILSGLFVYILLGIAIIAGSRTENILGAAVFYFVGAIVGLFSRLFSEWNRPNTTKNPNSAQNSNNTQSPDSAKEAVDDYGLTSARIIVTPVLAGLSALIGVLLVTMLSIVLIATVSTSNTSTGPSSMPTLTPVSSTPTTTSASNSSGLSYPKIPDIYDITIYPQNLVFAAVFGFLPSLAVGALKQQSDLIKSQIASSSISNQGT